MINPKELLFSVDEHNNPIEPQPRDISHATGIWHRAAHIWIINSKGQILCQQRSLLKDTNPGKWEPFFGGHLGPGQEYNDAAVSELGEELGIVTKPEQLSLVDIYKYDPGTEFQAVFTINWDGDTSDLRLEKDEVQEVRWIGLEEVEKAVLTNNDGNWTYMGYEPALLEELAARS